MIQTAMLDSLSEIDAADVVRCARALLRRPLLHSGGPDSDLLPLVHRHRVALGELFAQTLGYHLTVQRQFARLRKALPSLDCDRGIPGFTPRGYAYIALTIAALTGAGRQMLLSRLVAEVQAAAAEAGIPASVEDIADRRSFAAALRHLAGLGIITETEGSVTGVLGQTPTEALITIDTDLLGQLVIGQLDTDSPGALIEAAAHPGPRGIEHALRRQLVENPVVLYTDLPAEQADWLRRHVRRESALLERCFGLITEIRAEGVAITDPEDYLTDLLFPGASTVSRIALLALPELLNMNEPQQQDGRILVTYAQVRAVCDQLIADYPAAWSKLATEDPHSLTDDVLELLASLGLAHRDQAGWLLSPAGHRWLPEPDDHPSKGEPPRAEPVDSNWSLFDTTEEQL